jgi:carbon-monoxide dehydrogenase medium subunit
MEFAYHAPATLAEACALGRQWGAEAQYLAGGTELFPDYYRERECAKHLIALEGIVELRGIAVVDDRLRIGALTTVADVAASPLVREWLPALALAARSLGSPPIRSRATIGGNFCRAVACADLPPPAIVGETVLRIVGTGDPRELEAERFFLSPRKTVLGPGEVLAELLVPRQPPRSGSSYQRFARRSGSSLAVASVAARLTLKGGRIAGARVALGAVAPVPRLAVRAVEMLVGERASANLFAVAGAVCAEEALPISDLRGSAEFRRELVSVLARRAFNEAARRAGAEAA